MDGAVRHALVALEQAWPGVQKARLHLARDAAQTLPQELARVIERFGVRPLPVKTEKSWRAWLEGTRREALFIALTPPGLLRDGWPIGWELPWSLLGLIVWRTYLGGWDSNALASGRRYRSAYGVGGAWSACDWRAGRGRYFSIMQWAACARPFRRLCSFGPIGHVCCVMVKKLKCLLKRCVWARFLCCGQVIASRSMG